MGQDMIGYVPYTDESRPYMVTWDLVRGGVPVKESQRFSGLSTALNFCDALADGYVTPWKTISVHSQEYEFGRAEITRNGSLLLSLEPDMETRSGEIVDSGRRVWRAMGEDPFNADN